MIAESLEPSELPAGQKVDATDVKRAAEISAFEVAESAPAAPQVKRGRGRPKKIKAESARPSVSAAASSEIPSVETQVDYSKMCAAALKLPFDVAATRTRVEKIRVTDEEISEPAQLASVLVNIYMPALANQDPRTVVAWSFAASLGMLVYSKFLIFKSVKAQPETPAGDTATSEKKPDDQPAGPVLKPDSISADEAFRARPSAFN